MLDFMEDRADLLKWELEENKEGIFFRGQHLKTRIIPVYLSEDDPRRVPVDVTEDQEEQNRKQCYLPAWWVYRCADTEGKWCVAEAPQFLSMDNRNISIDMINPYEEELCVNHYVLTSRRDEEDPAAQEFEYQESDGEVTITGVHHYCERLHIPAFLDGKPVTEVSIPFHATEVHNLREVVMPDSVRSIDLPWRSDDLEDIQIPASAVLAEAPDYIEDTRWFGKQSDGAVYFQNYYCGTKGMPDARDLVIRDGTVGSIRWVDSKRTWESITFPSSFHQVGELGFLQSARCRLTIPESCKEVKAHFDRGCTPKIEINWEERDIE